MDSISLSATNAAGGTRVIGVGCRYYTTLRRGVFIADTRSVEATFAIAPAWQGQWKNVGYITHTIIAYKRGLCHLCYRCVQEGDYIADVVVAIFVGCCGLCATTLFSDGGHPRPPCSNRGIYNAVFILRPQNLHRLSAVHTTRRKIKRRIK